ncbi:SusC/RagA family TonB-linked outer membrane protein [Parapedobacter sp. 10938]|uniref:SusC/RagA family TonB-linked outer membrane protein n=1 Tax=Parapedobacter flavus TaxID=3110225 RepID=UPI002DB61ECE|nr:TonB-dependent receptor [Parapedobacter sp. 10938]MEC3880126.1 TonB-dependent receptor [Parapedobacter sp. 10938]
MRSLFLVSICILWCSAGFSQQTVRGTVNDESGVALAGVSIRQVGTSSGTFTNESGVFSIVLDDASSPQLLFTMVGYSPQELDVSGMNAVEVILSGQGIDLEQVVVVGYGEQKKASVTGAISSVTSDEITSTPASSATNALTGRVPGLITRQVSGRPGQDDAALFIRGKATFNNSNPLVLVDGVERDFRQIEASDIESISVLKDASATAVYGVRGANGVVLVTTKRGAVGKSKINFNAEYGLTHFNRLTEALNAETTSRFQREGTINVGLDPSSTSNTSNFPVSEYDNYLYRTQENPFTHPDNNFVETFTKPGSQQRYNLNITGGNKVVRYFVSAGYFTQEGMFESDINALRERPDLKQLIELSPEVDEALGPKEYDASYFYNRVTTRSNIDITLSEDLKLGVNMSYLFRKENRPATYDGLGSNGEGLRLFAAFYRNAPQAFPLMNPNGSFGGAIGVWRQNPLVTIANTGFRSDFSNELQTAFTLDYDLRKLLKGLSVDGKYAFDVDWNNWRGMQWRPYLYAYNPQNDSYLQGLRGVLPFQDSGKTSGAYNQYAELSVRYKQEFNGHHVSGVVLGNFNARSVPGGQYSYVPHVYQAVIGRANYDYRNRYLLEVNLGYNGSNRFAKGHRYQLFPAVSAGWILTNEAFMPEWDALNFLKVRGSFGQVGNDQLGNFSYYYRSTYVNGASYSFGETHNPNVTGLQEGRMANEQIQWEMASKYNLGLETRWLRSRLTLNADMFKEHRTNILTIPDRFLMMAGINSLAPENLGVVDNRGFELELGWRDKTSKDFNYFAKAQYAYARNTIIAMSEVNQPFDYMKATGHPIGQFIGYQFDGFFDSYEEIAASPQQFGLSNVAPGDIKYKDINRDGIIDQNDQSIIGNSTTPEYTFSLSTGVTYKGISLSVLLQGATRSSVYMAGDVGWDNSWGNYFAEHVNRWTPETADVATYPRFLQKANGNHQNYFLSDFWLRDGKYLRLKNIQIGYTLPNTLLGKLPLNTVRIFANAFNVFTWDEVKRIDPESNPDRNVGRFYPQQRVINFGLNVGF